MESVDHWAGDDPRIQVHRGGRIDDERTCVLLWVQRAQRARMNPAANVAIELAREIGVPVVALFCLVPGFPSATLRSYQFMAEGLRELPDAFAARGIGWVLETGEPLEVVPRVAARLGAAAIVTDLNPLRIGRAWREDVAEAFPGPMLIVDSDTVVPAGLFTKEEYAARTMRPKVQRALDQYLVREPERRASERSDHREGPDPLDAIASFDLDRSVGAAPDFRGGTSEARTRLQGFIDHRLERYDTERNRADIDAGTTLSPYLHFGQISPLEVALAARDADAPAPAKESLLDELIVQRELAINFALRNPDYDRYAGLPRWARESLEKHRGDVREVTYTRSAFEHGETHDALWNAAMTQMRHEGWLPNRLRMYWAKQILRWSPSAETAFRTTVYLNDRYFLDGRDANSYANIGWAIGGRHDRPFGPEKAVIGLVRPLGMPAMKRSFDVDAYIAKVRDRWGDA